MTDLPKLSPAVYHGAVGDLVAAADPHTEASEIGVAMTAITGVGNALGRGAYWEAGSTRHGCNLFVTLVGDTASGRKGTAGAVGARFVQRADEDWATACRASGLSSGEGLIHRVRDQRSEKRAAKKGETDRADADGTIEDVVDYGVIDKRLLVYEGEFVSVLQRMRREGNTLSPILRDGWDGIDLEVVTKGKPERATGAHISILAHITPAELRRELTAGDATNGFANRFLFVLVERSKLLPLGGSLDQPEFEDPIEEIRKALAFGRDLGEVGFTPTAADRWVSIYSELSEGSATLAGAVTARAAPQVRRLAVIYAVLDRSTAVDVPHLEAACGVWDYCRQSAELIFDDVPDDPLAASVLRKLRAAGADGLTRTELYVAFGHHRRSDDLAGAAERLAAEGLVRWSDGPTGGRPVRRYFADSPGRSKRAESSESRAEPKHDPAADPYCAHKGSAAHEGNGSVEPSALSEPFEHPRQNENGGPSADDEAELERLRAGARGDQ